MKKSTKGALAAGSAAVLLMGGAGTLAFWTATDDVDGGTINSGSLTLEVGACDAWVYAATDLEGAGDLVNLVVPGDTIEQTCAVTIDGTGDHLIADVAIDATSVADITLGAPTADTLAVSAELVGATDGVEIDGPQTVDVVITVAYPYGTENNDSQLSTATLGAINLDAVQVHD